MSEVFPGGPAVRQRPRPRGDAVTLLSGPQVSDYPSERNDRQKNIKRPINLHISRWCVTGVFSSPASFFKLLIRECPVSGRPTEA